MSKPTPLQEWLARKGIDPDEARQKCAKRGEKALGGFTTLMQHDYTLPRLALAVARALGIPARDARPMGRPLDPTRWKKISDLSKPYPEDIDPEWYLRLKEKEAEKKQKQDLIQGRTWLNVMEFRRILTARGINWEDWVKEHQALYQGARSFSAVPETRKRHVQEVAELLEVDPEQLLTHIAMIADQRIAYGGYGTKPVTDGQARGDPMSLKCRIDADRIQAIMRANGVTEAEAGRRYAESNGGMERTEAGYANAFRYWLRGVRSAVHSQWATAEHFAAAIGCEPEDIAVRLTAEEVYLLNKKNRTVDYEKP